MTGVSLRPGTCAINRIMEERRESRFVKFVAFNKGVEADPSNPFNRQKPINEFSVG